MGKENCCSLRSVKDHNCKSNRDRAVNDDNSDLLKLKLKDGESMKSMLKSVGDKCQSKNVTYPPSVDEQWPKKCYSQCQRSCATLNYSVGSKSASKKDADELSTELQISSQIYDQDSTKSGGKSTGGKSTGGKSIGGKSTSGKSTGGKSAGGKSACSSMKSACSSKKSTCSESSRKNSGDENTKDGAGDKSHSKSASKSASVKKVAVTSPTSSKGSRKKAARIPSSIGSENSKKSTKSNKSGKSKGSSLGKMSSGGLSSRPSSSKSPKDGDSRKTSRTSSPTKKSTTKEKSKSGLTLPSSKTTDQSYKTAGKICRCSKSNIGGDGDDLPLAVNYLIYFFRNVYKDPFRWSIFKSVLMFLVCIKMARECNCLKIPTKHYEPFVD